MKSEQPIDDAHARATHEWMDGLAGRPGGGPEHAAGGRVRAALAPGAQDSPVATWRDIEARARAETAADAGVAPPDSRSLAGQAGPAEAANDPRPWRRLGWAAALLLVVGLASLLLPPAPDPALRGVAGHASSGPRWLVERPSEAAEALAAELRGLQAEVTVTSAGDAVILDIRAHPGAMTAVNQRLATLETGLDADGRLRLVVLPMR